MTVVRINLAKYDNEVTATVDWFLKRANSGKPNVPEEGSEPVKATLQTLVNGREAFEAVYNKIERAKYSVDIAIWGFQPSMFFRRDGHSHCIGELLIKKILDNPQFQVRLLVWQMVGSLETVMEANLGNFPELLLFQKGRVDGVSDEQAAYDRFWYEAIRGNLLTREELSDAVLKGIGNVDKVFMDYHYFRKRHLFSPELLRQFNVSPYRKNLQVKFRSVASQQNTYLDDKLPSQAQLVLKTTASHHQKTVLIDYESPQDAVGFVLEHNMVDNYWDDDSHSMAVADSPNIGKNSPTPLQDVSSIVSGQVLWDLNRNFCDSWLRQDSRLWNHRLSVAEQAREQEVIAARRKIGREVFPLSGEGTKLMAQILRTYDKPDVEDIKAMYLRNIRHTTSYIYTENQYFRFPPLVKAFIAHWNTLRQNNRDNSKPIHWFVVTNSSDAGIGSGTYTTNEMFKLLGRQEVMPEVAKQVRIQELEQEIRTSRLKGDSQEVEQGLKSLERINAIPIGTELKEAQGGLDEKAKALSNVRPYSQKEVEQLKQQIDDLKAARKKVDDLSDENSDADKNVNLTRQLYGELADTPGIKAHICTLAPQSATHPGEYLNDIKHEVYVHSKVTIIDDVFLFIGSANLNTRSMQVDTELGIISECKQVSQTLRQRLWQIHTQQAVGSAMNPNELSRYQNAEKAFKEWEVVLNFKKGKKIIDSPIREFIRMSPAISKSD